MVSMGLVVTILAYKDGTYETRLSCDRIVPHIPRKITGKLYTYRHLVQLYVDCIDSTWREHKKGKEKA